MATGTATPTLGTTIPGGNIEAYPKSYEISGTVALSAATDTYATNGLAFDISKLSVPGSALPIYFNVRGIGGFVYVFVAGSTRANGKLVIQQSAAAGNPFGEYSNGAALTAPYADTITFTAKFPKV